MEIPSPDPRFALLGGLAAGVASERFRRSVGRGIGYVARGVLVVGGPVGIVFRDVYDSAREVAAPKQKPRSQRTAKAAHSFRVTCGSEAPARRISSKASRT